MQPISFKSDRLLGNSADIIVPAAMMKDLGLRPDQSVDLNVLDGRLVVKPLAKPRHKLSDLLSQMESEFPRVDGWEASPSVGVEIA
ncbi:MAG: AbrB/MazE/SpoVT family DNA-binding domain-containing protein [Hydrogenophilales bacterium CG_4_9_14_3_um_filter_59_35]|nr:MAG: AbrB/MazE/SpoVT family DNA-binding domain-containing protein [Hydrogenophilales bacterium CG_4_9_14_3_um_filter_59_35]